MSKQYHILWVDDEVDLLKPHMIYLEEKGYKITPCVSGVDAIEMVRESPYDLIFLDEHMPGLTGLETLEQLKVIAPFTPIVMVTKSEEERIMNEAIGKHIADYLIKPVSPIQVLTTLKKLLHRDSLVTEVTMQGFQSFFREMSMRLNDRLTIGEWQEVYRSLTQWSIDLEQNLPEVREIFDGLKNDAEQMFARYVKNNYADWLSNSSERPVMSPDLFKQKIFPMLDQGDKVFLILIDNFRWDQWLTVKPLLAQMYDIHDEMYTSILPTATQYARNAIFSGLMPDKIAELFPDLWVDEESEEGKNMNEEPMIQTLFDRYRRKHKFSYTKVYDKAFGDKMLNQFERMSHNDLNVIVLNFVDMLSHARTESKMIRELANSDAAYRSLTKSWFEHSITLQLFKKIASMGYKVLLTTDHGTIEVQKPLKVIGDKNLSTNLRYKFGQTVSYDADEVMAIDKPKQFGLPATSLRDKYIFCMGRDFFAYPNNYNYYVKYYKNTFQHGGISMEEMLIPLITLDPK